MSGFFGFLAFVAFIAFIIGMIKPSIVVFWSKKKTRGFASLYLAAMVLFGIFAGISSSGPSLPKAPTTSGVQNTSSQHAISTISSPKTSASPSSAAISKPYSTQLSSGHYTSGIDFPSGTYDINAVKGNGNVTTTNMYSGGLNAIMGVKGENYEKEYKNIQIPDGVVLSVSSVTIKISSKGNVNVSSLKKRTNTATKEVTLSSGNYVAGKDFPSGIYNITAVKGSGNVSSDNIYEGGLNAIMGTQTDDMYEKDYRNVSLTSGVTLKISGVTVKLTPSK